MQGERPVKMRDKRKLARKKNRRISRKITRKLGRKKIRIFSELYYQGVDGNRCEARENGRLKGWGVFRNFIIREHDDYITYFIS